MSYQFVDNTSLDAVVRKRIRSHVMKGKNLGKTRASKSRAVTTRVITTLSPPKERLHQNITSVSDPSTKDLLNLSRDAGSIQSSPPARPLSHEMTTWPFATQIDRQSQQTVHDFLRILNFALYPANVCVRPDVSKLVWFQYLFEDQAFLSAALALSETFNNTMAGRIDDSVVTVKHLSKAYSLLNINIENHGTSDFIIATILYISLRERMQGQFERGQIHVKVLKNMVALRGGIERMLENRSLSQKIFFADIETSIHDGIPTHFNLKDIPGDKELKSLRREVFHDSRQPMKMSLSEMISLETVEVFLDLTALSEYSRISYIPRLSSATFGDVLVSINYKILESAPLKIDAAVYIFDTLYRLSALTFMISFWHTPCVKHQRFQLLRQRLGFAIEALMLPEFECQKFILWVVTIGACSIFKDFDDPWLRRIVLDIGNDLSITSWEQAEVLLSDFPWIAAFHAKVGKQLWRAIESWQESPTQL